MLSEKITDKIKTLAAAKAKLAELEQSLVAELRAEFAALHARFGFADRQAFLDAVKKAGGPRTSGIRPRPASKARKAPARPPTKTPAKKKTSPARRSRAASRAK